MKRSLLFPNTKVMPALPHWNKLKEMNVILSKQHKELIKIFPNAVWKFYKAEYAKDSQAEEVIESKKVFETSAVYPNRSGTTLWSYIYQNSNVKEDEVYNHYMNLHSADIPWRALWFTPNGNWLSRHLQHSPDLLTLKKDHGTGMRCIPLDIDKKDYDKIGYPLPEQFLEYWTWANVESFEFVYWWFDQTRDLVPDAFEWINKQFYKDIVNNIGFICVTPGWFHAYIMISPNDRKKKFFKDMTNADYNTYMNIFHKIVGQDLMFDASKTNMSDVFRLPATLHRKYRRKIDDRERTFFTVPLTINKINYDEYNEDWTKREHVVELWEPYWVKADTMKYAKDWWIQMIFEQMKERSDDPECLKKINWYRNEVNVKQYKEQHWEKQLNMWEKEVRRCCNEWRLDWWKVITNLPGWHIDFWPSYWSLKFRNIQWQLENTSWYKFKRLWLIPEAYIKNIKTGNTIYTDEWMECNYCWWYVNDWFSNHWRPSGPMLNFVYMYFQQCVLDKDATVSEIFDAVRKYFKRICPQIKDNLISNYQPANPNHKVYGKPSCYIECWPENVTCVFEKQTADWKPVNLSNGLIVFNQPVNFIGRAYIQNDWIKFISNSEQEACQNYVNDDGSYKESWSTIIVKYLLEVNKRVFGISNCETAIKLEKQLNSSRSWLHFCWNDTLCRMFFSALDFASDQTLPTYEEYWLKTIYWNQGSRYWINNNTGKPFCVIGDTAMCWDAPEILEWIDATAKDIIDFNIQEVPVKEYRKHIQGLWEPKVYQKIFISSWSCQFMNIAEDVMNSNAGITLWPNVNIYGWSETWKSSLRFAIQSSFWYKAGKKYLSMQMTTPQPLIDSMADWACMLYEEMTSKVESDQKKQEAKEIVIRGAANKEVKMTGWVTAKRSVKMRSCNIYFGESSIKDDSANNRIIKIKLTKKVRNPNREEWESELHWLQNHTIKGELYKSIMELYEHMDFTIPKLAEYKKIIASHTDNERLWDLECYGMLLYVDTFKLGTIEQFLEMIDYNIENDISNIRDTTKSDPTSQVQSLVHWLLHRANRENSSITIATFDTYDEKYSIYNHYGWENYTMVLKIDLATITTNISNFDNDVEKINEIVPGFVKTLDQCIYICSYGDEIITKLEEALWEWLIEWIDIDMFKDINSKIRLTSIMMSQKNRNNNWLDYNGATHDHHCPDDYWKVIRKVFYSTNVML